MKRGSRADNVVGNERGRAMSRTTRTGHLVLATVLTTLAAAATACSPSTDKAGGPAAKVVLTLASNDFGPLSAAPPVADFARRLSRVSDGRLSVKLKAGWAGGSSEAQVVEDVARGTVDLGWAGSQALDLAGVSEMKPFSLPYLVDSYALQASVVRSLGARLLTAVGKTGVRPLALLPDQIRFVAADRPLTTPAAWEGRRFRVLASIGAHAAVRALGADPVGDPNTVPVLREEHSIDSAEGSWQLYQRQSWWSSVPVVTVDPPLWTRTDVLFASPQLRDRLNKRQRAWLREAADDAAAYALTHAGAADEQQMRDACENGARLVPATPDQVDALRRQVAPLYQQARQDTAQADVLGTIEKLKAGLTPERATAIPAGCGFDPANPPVGTDVSDPLVEPGATKNFPLGTYRYRVMQRDLMSTPTVRPAENAGIWTWSMGRGTWSLSVRLDDSQELAYPCSGLYTVAGHEVKFTRVVNQPHGDCVPYTWGATWAIDPGGVRWTGLTIPEFATVFNHHVWTRID